MNYIGTDESGKGDYFGYIVVAAVLMDNNNAIKRAVKDSKKVLDSEIFKLERAIKKNTHYSVVKISPSEYNEIYPRIKNMNKILAWMHARAIENLLQRNNCDLIIVDKFCDEKIMKDAVFEKTSKIKIIQKVNGEKEPAVAAASILARSEFIRTMKSMEKQLGTRFPKGARTVVNFGKKLVNSYGKNILYQTAKYNFKTSKNIITN